MASKLVKATLDDPDTTKTSVRRVNFSVSFLLVISA